MSRRNCPNQDLRDGLRGKRGTGARDQVRGLPDHGPAGWLAYGCGPAPAPTGPIEQACLFQRQLAAERQDRLDVLGLVQNNAGRGLDRVMECSVSRRCGSNAQNASGSGVSESRIDSTCVTPSALSYSSSARQRRRGRRARAGSLDRGGTVARQRMAAKCHWRVAVPGDYKPRRVCKSTTNGRRRE